MPNLTGNIQPQLDVSEHVDQNWGFQPGKAVYPVEGVPTGGYKSNATVIVTTNPTNITIDKYILSGATICRFQQVIDTTNPDILGLSAWKLV